MDPLFSCVFYCTFHNRLSNDILQKVILKKSSQSLSSEALTFGHKRFQNAVKQNLHDCQFFIALEGVGGGGGGAGGKRHNFVGPTFLDPPLFFADLFSQSS